LNDLKDSLILILLVAVLTAYQALSILSSRTYQLTQDARATRLVAGCELWDIVPPSQPTRTLVLACPRMDVIRLWPLPVLQKGFRMGDIPIVIIRRMCPKGS
jgi:hypothetical protein